MNHRRANNSDVDFRLIVFKRYRILLFLYHHHLQFRKWLNDWPNKVLPLEYEVRDLIPHIGLIPKVIPLKLFLDIVPSLPADVNGRCVDVLAYILETIRNAMAGNVV